MVAVGVAVGSGMTLAVDGGLLVGRMATASVVAVGATVCSGAAVAAGRLVGALVMVLEWANEHRAELMEDWNLCRAKQLPKPIKPLE